ncbi:DUF2569 domain-containing protein [Paenibacillus paeoniae]|uniref:DUF2569 domain-containing protein n=1 Tax=Paenibacillus paeoniae TaxID=2292705 RepID=A0A371PLF3_9BACL|nr:DUF2569 domain-containing protein [Paenibacillus paeoniae]REK77036.1 DUF2569 domain-containing protein [Paenibacillus paeoniae]
METQTQATQEIKPLPQLISGLGGWLVVVQIGLYVTIIASFFQFMGSVSIFGDGSWELLTQKGSAMYHALWKPLILFEVIYHVLFFAFWIYIIVCFYSKKAILPRLMIIYFSSFLIVGVIDYALLLQIPLAKSLDDGSTIFELVRSAGVCLIWIPYFIRSIRVKNTFIH